ncbi:hypothetical protein [Vibrio alginolyticus]
MKKLYQFTVAVVALLFASVALASSGMMEPDTPAWAAAALGFVATVVGVVAQIDAQVPEEFKGKWPWWLRWVWNAAAGNYKYSQNIGSS